MGALWVKIKIRQVCELLPIWGVNLWSTFFPYRLYFFISFLIACSDGRIQENQDQIAQNQSASSELKHAGESNQPMAEWHEKLLTSLQANHTPLSRNVLIHDKGIKKIEIFLINGPLISEVPMDAESIRKTVWEATHDSTHPNYGRKSAFAYIHYRKPHIRKLLNLSTLFMLHLLIILLKI